MNVLTCTAVGRQLDAFHDEELPVSDQIAVSAHLEGCRPCAEAYADLRLVRDAVRAVAPGRRGLSADEATSIRTSVVNRVRAEHSSSLAVRVGDMFDDMHLVYAGLGATVAMLFCVVTFAAMFHLATQGPGSNANPVSLDGRVLMPVALDGGFLTLVDPDDPAGAFGPVGLSALAGLSGPAGAGDSEFMICAVVTREGTVANPELVHAMSDQKPVAPGTEEARAAETLMGAVSRARFEPARVAGQTVAVNMVWLVANTTVLGERPAMVRPAPGAARKPVAWHAGTGVRVRAA